MWARPWRSRLITGDGERELCWEYPPQNTAKVEVVLDGMSFIVHSGLVRSLATGRWIGASENDEPS
jgi:hypothetical protein